MLKRNYDLVVTAATAGVLMIVGVPWPFWVVLAGIVAYQAANRYRAARR